MCHRTQLILKRRRFALLLVVTILSISLLNAQEMDEWNVPWTTIGDSTRTNSAEEKLVLTGKVINEENGLPVAGATISVDFFKHFDYTDANGAYVLELPPGNYRMKVRYIGMIPQYYRIRIYGNGVLNIQLTEGSIELGEVVITARPLDSNIKQSLPGLTQMSVAEIKTLPTLMGEVDIVKSLQLMPGVTSVGEGSSGVNVRGGRVDQNLVLFNGVPLFNTSHALGFVSAFNQDVIDDFSLYKGNVPANLGGRASAVIEINTRRGNFRDWQFQVGTGPAASRVTVEGPINKDKTSILLAARSSHANWLLRRVKDPDVSNSRVAFSDEYVGLSHRFSANSNLDLTFYGSQDVFRFSDRFGYSYSNYLVNGKWQSRANKKLSPTLSLSYGSFTNAFFEPKEITGQENRNRMDYYQLKQDIHYIPIEGHDIRAGVSAIGYLPGNEKRRGYDGNEAVSQKSVDKSQGIEFGVFVNDDFVVSPNISISAGLRYSHFSHLGPDTVFQYRPGVPRSSSSIVDTVSYSDPKTIDAFGGLEPRLSMRLSLKENQSVKLSYNRMRQYIHLISNTTAPTPVDLWQVSTAFIPPQIADNFSVGYFLNLKDNKWETSFEIFHKTMDNLVEYKDFPRLLLNRHIETELLSGIGRASGGEIFVRKLKGRLTGWVSYTYSQTEVKVATTTGEQEINRGEWFPSNYNKPHNFNLVLNRSMRKQSAWSLIVSYASGRPFTAIESSYVAGGTVVPVYSDRNKLSIPAYFRVDFSLTIGNVLKKFDDSLVFSLYNLFGRDNAYSVFYQRPAANFFIPRPYKFSVLGASLPTLTYNIKF